MPLIRREPGVTGNATPARDAAADQLHDASAEIRWQAARALAHDETAVPALVAALGAEASPQVREAILTSLVQIGSRESALAISRFIQSDDAALRTAVLDALAAMPDRAETLLPALLRDDDPDVRLLSCELGRVLPPDIATRRLGALLEIERHINVCAAAVEVLAEVGTPDAVAPLLACKARFPNEAFLGFAIDEAVARAGAGRLTRNE